MLTPSVAECKYSGEFGDCDPFKMIKIKEERLLTGPASCEDKKNTTKPCHRGDFPPGQPSLSSARNHQPTFVWQVPCGSWRNTSFVSRNSRNWRQWSKIFTGLIWSLLLTCWSPTRPQVYRPHSPERTGLVQCLQWYEEETGRCQEWNCNHREEESRCRTDH